MYQISSSDDHLARRVHPWLDFIILVEVASIHDAIDLPDVWGLAAPDVFPIHSLEEWVYLDLIGSITS